MFGNKKNEEEILKMQQQLQNMLARGQQQAKQTYPEPGPAREEVQGPRPLMDITGQGKEHKSEPVYSEKDYLESMYSVLINIEEILIQLVRHYVGDEEDSEPEEEKPSKKERVKPRRGTPRPE